MRFEHCKERQWLTGAEHGHPKGTWFLVFCGPHCSLSFPFLMEAALLVHSSVPPSCSRSPRRKKPCDLQVSPRAIRKWKEHLGKSGCQPGGKSCRVFGVTARVLRMFSFPVPFRRKSPDPLNRLEVTTSPCTFQSSWSWAGPWSPVECWT